MNKPILIAVLISVLAACRQPAPEASLPASPVVDATAVASPADTAPKPVADDRETVNASIDSLLGDHDEYEAVIDAYQKAVAEGDEVAVAALVAYPLQATLDGKEVAIKDRADFVSNYDKIITPAIAGVIKAQKYSELMVNGQGVMFGSGETWINGMCKQGSADCSEFEARVVAIQPGAGD